MTETLYLKYRPRSLDEIVGQEPIKKIIRNSVKKDRMPHAYLLTGPKGTGKTSLARIIATIVNVEDGPSCDYDIKKSEICKSILKGGFPDIHEIDAATNRQIDNVRSISKTAYNAPIIGYKRVFIIDECHQFLSPAASALLKILEEPPESTIFILCTTEPQKILETIQSRCQRLNLKKVRNTLLVGHMQKICEIEGFEGVDPNALDLLAKAAKGCVRDALGNLELIMGASDGAIDVRFVADLLGISDQTLHCDILQNILDKDTKSLIVNLKKSYISGIEAKNLLEDFYEFVYNMLVAKCIEDHKHLYIEDGIKKRWKKLLDGFSIEQLNSLVYILDDYNKKMFYSSKPEIIMDSCCLSCIKEIS